MAGMTLYHVIYFLFTSFVYLGDPNFSSPPAISHVKACFVLFSTLPIRKSVQPGIEKEQMFSHQNILLQLKLKEL